MISLVPATFGDLGVSEEVMRDAEEQRRKQEEEVPTQLHYPLFQRLH